MKFFTLIALPTLFILAGCTKDSVQTNQALQNLPVESRGDKVTICHKTGNGEYQPISVNWSAVPAHLAHGDYLPDADGDGYTAIGACTGSMDDCNDDNAAVNPGAKEVCDNGIDDNCDGNVDVDFNYPCFNEETLNGASNFNFYIDTEIEDCLGLNNLALVESPEFTAAASNVSPDFPAFVVFFSTDGSIECFLEVGEGEGYISQADFDCTIALIRAFIAAHPEIPTFCDLNPLSGDGSSARVRPEISLKNLMPENLRKRMGKQ